MAGPDETPRVFEPPGPQAIRLVYIQGRNPWAVPLAALILAAAAAALTARAMAGHGPGRCAALEAEYWGPHGTGVPYQLWEASRCRAAQGQGAEAYRDYLFVMFRAVDSGDLPVEKVAREFSAALRGLRYTERLRAVEDCAFYRDNGVIASNIFPERFLFAARCYQRAGRVAQARRTYEELLGHIAARESLIHASSRDEGQTWKLKERLERELARLPAG